MKRIGGLVIAAVLAITGCGTGEPTDTTAAEPASITQLRSELDARAATLDAQQADLAIREARLTELGIRADEAWNDIEATCEGYPDQGHWARD